MATKPVKMEEKKQQVPVLGLDGQEIGRMDMPDLNKDVSMKLVAQVLHIQRARTRVRRAHTKERAEVRGGGRKPWRQKGTGRSRHGSRRSPIWVGGGITFGPRSRKTRHVPVPADMARKALWASLIEKRTMDSLAVVKIDDIPEKTKEIVEKLPEDMKGILILASSNNFVALQRVMRNLPDVMVARFDQVDTESVIKAKKVWIDESAWSDFWKKRLKFAVKVK
jgi:large subunit ribosomal protein L4